MRNLSDFNVSAQYKMSYLLPYRLTKEKYINSSELEQIKYNSAGLCTVSTKIEIDSRYNYNELVNLPPQTPS